MCPQAVKSSVMIELVSHFIMGLLDAGQKYWR